MNFLLSNLDSLLKGIDLKSFTITQKNVPRRRKAAVFLEEVIYPCDYMDSFQTFSETKLPAEKAFYSEANGKRIMEEGHEDAQNV